MFNARGEQAQDIIVLWWILFAIACLVFSLVAGFTITGVLRKNRSLVSDKALGKGLTCGIGATLFLLLVIILSTFKLSRPLTASEASAEILVKGKMWWWEVVYLNKDGDELFRTANEISLPAGQTVKLKLVSDTVIHSFWVPGLAGKMDMIPGRTNALSLRSDEAGVFRGQCAEFCGIQHSLMAFYAVVRTPQEHQEWVRLNARDYQRPQDPLALKGENVFLTSGCADCHRINGLNRVKDLENYGPNLTHLGSRLSLAGATMPNTKGHLGGWITDPQSAKPGNLMPPTALAPEDFKALLFFLRGLK